MSPPRLRKAPPSRPVDWQNASPEPGVQVPNAFREEALSRPAAAGRIVKAPDADIDVQRVLCVGKWEAQREQGTYEQITAKSFHCEQTPLFYFCFYPRSSNEKYAGYDVTRRTVVSGHSFLLSETSYPARPSAVFWAREL